LKIRVTPWIAWAGAVGWGKYSANPIASRRWKEVGGQHHVPVDLPPGKSPVPLVKLVE